MKSNSFFKFITSKIFINFMLSLFFGYLGVNYLWYEKNKLVKYIAFILKQILLYALITIIIFWAIETDPQLKYTKTVILSIFVICILVWWLLDVSFSVYDLIKDKKQDDKINFQVKLQQLILDSIAQNDKTYLQYVHLANQFRNDRFNLFIDFYFPNLSVKTNPMKIINHEGYEPFKN